MVGTGLKFSQCDGRGSVLMAKSPEMRDKIPSSQELCRSARSGSTTYAKCCWIVWGKKRVSVTKTIGQEL